MDLLDDLIKDPFGAAAVRELCRKPGLFDPGRMYRRIEICDTLRKEFVRHGGASGTTNAAVATVLKKWLLRPGSPFRREARGRYRFLGFERDTMQYPGTGIGGYAVRDAPAYDGPMPELEIGDGPCEVYFWCLPGYRASDGERWPIKIGRAGVEGFRGQLRDFRENLPERPRYLLRLGCADIGEAHYRESMLHTWFTERGQELEKGSGDDWFLTNPGEIEEAVQELLEAELPASTTNLQEEERKFAEAFKGIPDEDWANIPDDLIDRLDEYLYGVHLK